MHDTHSIEPIEKLALLDLISLEELQQLQDNLSNMHQVASVITDPQGNLLTLPSNEISVCRLIQRSTVGLKHCMEVSRSMSTKLDAGKHQACHTCENIGILKAAVPILVNDIHVANWWVSQYCADTSAEDHLREFAREMEVPFNRLKEELQSLPKGEEKNFKKIIDWIRSLSHQIAKLVYEKHVLSNNLSKKSGKPNDPDKPSSVMEREIDARTAELIKANNRLQLEALERDLAEEQTGRKTRLLDAINIIFQQTLTDQNDESLAETLLRSASRITGSPYGFVAEQVSGNWKVTAVHHSQVAADSRDSAAKPEVSEIGKLWRQLMTQGRPLAIPGIDEDVQVGPLPKSCRGMNSFLAAPLCKDQRISGMIALAGKDEGYALVDQTDVEALAHAFIETLLRKRFEAEKVESEKRLNLALESANEGLWDYAPITGHMYYSPRWFSMLGYMPGEFPETLETWSTLAHPDDLPVLEQALQGLSEGAQVDFNIEIRMLSRSGKWLWLQVRGRVVDAEVEEKASRIVGTLIDISKYKQVEVALQKANNELQRLAALDDLTQIANRRRFEDRLTQEWRRGQRDNNSLAVIICDIDHFKDYNDAYGHLKGDETLYAVAQAISAALKRPMDLAARFGGEEFAMVLPNTDIVGAIRVAEEVKAAVETLAIDHSSSPVSPYITMSFGVAALIPAPELSAKTLIENSDRALYRAKSKGRNRIFSISGQDEYDSTDDDGDPSG